MTQVAMIVRPLKTRLSSVYWDDMTDVHLPLRRITASAGYAGRFPGITEVRSLVGRATAGRRATNGIWVGAYSGSSTRRPAGRGLVTGP